MKMQAHYPHPIATIGCRRSFELVKIELKTMIGIKKISKHKFSLNAFSLRAEVAIVFIDENLDQSLGGFALTSRLGNNHCGGHLGILLAQWAFPLKKY